MALFHFSLQTMNKELMEVDKSDTGMWMVAHKGTSWQSGKRKRKNIPFYFRWNWWQIINKELYTITASNKNFKQMFVHHPACACYSCALIDTSWLWHVFTDIPTTDVFFSGNKKCKYSIKPRHKTAPYLRKNNHDSFLFPHSVWRMACATKPIVANLSQSKIRFAVLFLPCVNFIKKVHQ